MEILALHQQQKVQTEKDIITQLYNNFIKSNEIKNHNIFETDIICKKLTYESFHFDTGGLVGNEYEIHVELRNSTTSIRINVDKSNCDSGFRKSMSVYVMKN